MQGEDVRLKRDKPVQVDDGAMGDVLDRVKVLWTGARTWETSLISEPHVVAI